MTVDKGLEMWDSWLSKQGNKPMTLGSKEHHEVIEAFEKIYTHKELLVKRPREDWKNGVYVNEFVDTLFNVFRHGVAFGKAL